MQILFIGDVVGKSGCRYLERTLPELRRQYGADVTIVNGENSAPGNGITAASAEQILRCGADLITTGNHAFQRRDSLAVFERREILRPANYPEGCPGHGLEILDLGRCRVEVLNLMGTVYLEALDNPFAAADALLAGIDTPNIFVDFHAEATSEKKCMGYYLAGRVTAVCGTHTHVQTADEEILEGHTGYITDAGMTGPARSVLGVDVQRATDKQRLHCPVQFIEADGPAMLNGVSIAFDPSTGKCTKIQRIFMRESTNMR